MAEFRIYPRALRDRCFSLVLFSACAGAASAVSSGPPSHDECSAPFSLGIGHQTSFIGYHFATTSTDGQGNANCESPPGSPAFGSLAIENDVWFVWTSNCNGHAEFTTCDLSPDDTKIAVYGPAVSACPSTQAIACNDDFCGTGGVHSTVSFNTGFCQDFLIQVGVKPGTAPDSGQITVTCVPDSGLPNCGPTVACCLPNGMCGDVQSACCAAHGGAPSGISSTCLGTGIVNFDEVDEACECFVPFETSPCHDCPGLPCRPTTIRFTDYGTFVGQCACIADESACLPGWPNLGCSGACDSGLQCLGRTTSIFTGFEAIFECLCTTPCTNHVDCDPGVCHCGRCFADGSCALGTVRYGELTGNGIVNLDDILCVLTGFSNFSACRNGDIAPGCSGDQAITIDDILAILAAFAGANPCGCVSTTGDPICFQP